MMAKNVHCRDVHRGGKSAAAAPPSFQKIETATLPRRGVMESETHRAAAAPHSNGIYRCRAATATTLKYSIENFTSLK